MAMASAFRLEMDVETAVLSVSVVCPCCCAVQAHSQSLVDKTLQRVNCPDMKTETKCFTAKAVYTSTTRYRAIG